MGQCAPLLHCRKLAAAGTWDISSNSHFAGAQFLLAQSLELVAQLAHHGLENRANDSIPVACGSRIYCPYSSNGHMSEGRYRHCARCRLHRQTLEWTSPGSMWSRTRLPSASAAASVALRRSNIRGIDGTPILQPAPVVLLAFRPGTARVKSLCQTTSAPRAYLALMRGVSPARPFPRYRPIRATASPTCSSPLRAPARQAADESDAVTAR